MDSQSFLKKVKSLCSNISVEPVVLLIIVPSMIYQLATQNLYMEKACRVSLEMNISTCDALTQRNRDGYTSFEEAEVQKLTSKMIAIKSLIQGIIPLILAVSLGSWSDRHNKRKPIILAPVLGELLSCLLLIVNVYFFYELPLILSTLAESLPLALLGGWPCMFIGAYSYVASKSTNKNGTIRIGSLSITHTASLVLGVGTSGILITAFGFITTYVICSVMILIGFTYGFLFIEDIKKVDETTKSEDRVTSKTGLLDILDLSYFFGTFKVCFKCGPNNRRRNIMIILVIVFLLSGNYHGEGTVVYLYTRLKFGWNALDFSSFNFFKLFIKVIGSTVGLLLFSKCLKWKDASLGMIGQGCSFLASLIYAFSINVFFFYSANFVDVFYMISHIALRSIVAKVVPSNELGQINSVYGIFDTLGGIVFNPIYSLLYNSTITVFPGTFFLLSALLRITAALLFMYLYMEVHKNEKSEEKIEENVEHSEHLQEDIL